MKEGRDLKKRLYFEGKGKTKKKNEKKLRNIGKKRKEKRLKVKKGMKIKGI